MTMQPGTAHGLLDNKIGTEVTLVNSNLGLTMVGVLSYERDRHSWYVTRTTGARSKFSSIEIESVAGGVITVLTSRPAK